MGLRYSPLKIFHFPKKLASLPRESPDVEPPVHVRIKPTNVCNHRCRYCSYRAPDLQLGQEMIERQSISKPKMFEVVDDLIAMGVQAVTFSGGGEPLCYPHLIEAAERLAASPVRFATLTNGARLDGDIARLFARSATWIRVSMDGWDDESYARYRDVPLSEFERVVRNIEAFKALGGPCAAGINYIVDAENAGHVHEIIGLAKRIGADSVKIAPCIVSDNAESSQAYHAPLFDRVHTQIARARVDFEEAGFEIYDAYHELQTVFAKPYAWCPHLQIQPVIGADLCVYTCHDKAYHPAGVLGSLEHMRFRDFWMNGKDKFFAVNPCRECRHHCAADRVNRLVLEYLNLDRDHLDFA